MVKATDRAVITSALDFSSAGQQPANNIHGDMPYPWRQFNNLQTI